LWCLDRYSRRPSWIARATVSYVMPLVAITVHLPAVAWPCQATLRGSLFDLAR
jgi:hypothetical protein